MAIELTEEHKTKFLELCKELYPNYINDDYNLWTFEKGIISYWKYNSTAEWSEPIIQAPWFEFLYFHLLEEIAILRKITKEDFTEILVSIYRDSPHPIDVAYYNYKFYDANKENEYSNLVNKNIMKDETT